MSAWYQLRQTSRGTRVLLCALFVLFNVFAVLRALPVNSGLDENRLAERGTYHRNVYRVFRLAERQAARPFFDVRNHALYFDRNPGLFLLVAELLVRAGAGTPFANQLLAIALWDAGFVLLYLWLLALFRSELAAVVAVAFMLFTPFALFYSSSIHHEPWCFFFFNLTLYCYVSYLRTPERRWLIATWLAYFLLCQSYWFYYMSAGLLLLALQIREQQLTPRDTLLLALVPVAATFTTFLQVAYALGSFEAAQFRMLDIAAARTLDLRIEGSEWYPHKRFLQPHHLRSYPQIVRERIETLSGVPLLALLSMLAASCILSWRRLVFMLPVLLAALSWSLVMVQHTVIHRFAGMYGWFAWVLIVAVFVHELELLAKPHWRRAIVLALALLLVAPSLSRDYAPYLRRYAIAAYTGQPQPRSFVRPNKQGPQPSAADPLDQDEAE